MKYTHCIGFLSRRQRERSDKAKRRRHRDRLILVRDEPGLKMWRRHGEVAASEPCHEPDTEDEMKRSWVQKKLADWLFNLPDIRWWR